MIHVENAGDLVVLKLRHGRANALDLEFCNALADEVDRLAAAGDAGALVIIGEGGIFSAGADLKRVAAGGRNYVARFLPAMRRLFEAVFFCPKPVVAAINGHAIAGGCILACAADRRLAAATGLKIGVPELQVGVAFPPTAVEILRHMVPPKHLYDVVYRGTTYAPKAALSMGLIDRVVDGEELQAAAETEARRLGALRGNAYSLTKRVLRDPVRNRIEAAAELDAEIHKDWQSEDCREAIQAYVSRTLK